MHACLPCLSLCDVLPWDSVSNVHYQIQTLRLHEPEQTLFLNRIIWLLVVYYSNVKTD